MAEHVAEKRPWGVTAMSIFFMVSTAISLTAAVSMAIPGSVLEPMWRLNPRARQAFGSLEGWAALLLGTVSFACGVAATGLWKGKRWGYRVAIALLTANLLGDVVNVVLGLERRAAFGIPVVVALLAFLMSRRVRSFFNNGPRHEYRAA